MKMFYPDYPNLEFVLRLLVAALLGGVVGLERELRAKEAGIRTHFLVALGSALLMIISQYGFSEAPGRAADPSRLAAQIVSGIGFLCAGTIIFRREAVKGLTTAAGLWVAAGIGMAVGCGMYLLAVAASLLTLAGFELVSFSVHRLGFRTRTLHLVFTAKNDAAAEKAMSQLRSGNCSIGECSLKKDNDGSVKVSLSLHCRTRSDAETEHLIHKMEKTSGIHLDRFE